LANCICGGEGSSIEYRSATSIDRFRAFTGADVKWEPGRSRFYDAVAYLDACNVRLVTVLKSKDTQLPAVWGRLFLEEFADASPSLPLDLTTKPPWSRRDMLDWFLSAVETPPTHVTIVRPRKGRVSGRRRHRESIEEGWYFSDCSTQMHQRSGERPVSADMVVLASGELRLPDDDLPGRMNFSANGLRRMAQLAQLTPDSTTVWASYMQIGHHVTLFKDGAPASSDDFM
jgi:hypothetical protein